MCYRLTALGLLALLNMMGCVASQNTAPTGVPGAATVPWKAVEMTIDGVPRQLQIREYPSAVPLKQVVDSIENSSTGSNSAMGCYAQTVVASRRVRSQRDLQKLAELFDDPDQIMRFYAEQAKLRGGFERYAAMIRKHSDKAYNGKCLLGEILISDQHVFVNKMPDIGQTTFTVFRKGKDGLYRNVNEWDATVNPFLVNRRVLDLFGLPRGDQANSSTHSTDLQPILPIAKNCGWSHIEVPIEGQTHSLVYRRYPSPISQEALCEYSSHRDGPGLSVLATNVSYYVEAKGVESVDDMRKLGRYAYYPEQVAADENRYVEQAGGWEKMLGTAQRAGKAMAKQEYIGEAIYGKYHILIFRTPGSSELYKVYAKKADKKYYLLNKWPSNLSNILKNQRLASITP